MWLLWVIPGNYGLFRVIMSYSGLLWGFVAPVGFLTLSQSWPNVGKYTEDRRL